MAPAAALSNVTSSSSPDTSGLVERAQTFVSENRRLVLLGAALAVAAAGGVGYYLYTSGGPSSPRSKQSSAEHDDSEGEAKSASGKAHKKKRKSKKKTGKEAADGPILEERKPKSSSVSVESEDGSDEPYLTDDAIAQMSSSERDDRAGIYKTKGNTAYQARKFHEAVELYTQAIRVAHKPQAVFYSNRAASYLYYSPPQYERVVEDTTEALKLDNHYIKALSRRALALEALNRDEEALRDYTATTILERFGNEQTSAAMEKVLKKIASQKAAETMASREPRLPSHTFVSAYLAAFRSRPLPTLPEQPSQGDETYLMACEALQANDFIHGYTLVGEALDQGISWDEGKAKALNLRGTFKFLIGAVTEAKADLEESLRLLPSFTQTWVKIASVHMELGDPKSAFEAFDQAIKYDESDPDIYYHRGQVHFIMGQFDFASEDYNKSTALDDTFVFSQIQYAVAQYKKGEVASSMAAFRRTMKAFPDRSEPLNYYGELLLDTQRYDDAIDKFDKAIEIEKAKKPPINVLAMVNKGLAMYQWKQDVASARTLCEEALAMDPECDAAIATLAQLYLQASRLDDAIEMFQRHIKIARTISELEQTYSFEYATRAQKEFGKNYPEKAAELEQLAKAMA